MTSLPDFLDDAPPLGDDQLEAYFDWEDLPGEPEPPDIASAAQATVVQWNNADAARRWEVTDRAGAEWAMRKLVAARAELASIEASAAEWKRQVDMWLARERRPHVQRAGFMESHLIEYLRRLREVDPKHKSEHLPSGEIVSRKVPARPEVANDEAFLAWAETLLPGAVKIKRSPVIAEIRRAVTWREVYVPDFGEYDDTVYEANGALVAVPPALSDEQVDEMLDGLDPVQLANYHIERLPIFTILLTPSGEDLGLERLYALVPGLIEVPETVNYDVKPVLA